MKPCPRVRWDNPEEMREWFWRVREQLANAFAAGEDSTRPLKNRVLSRAEVRRKLEEAEKSLRALLDAAEPAPEPGAAE